MKIAIHIVIWIIALLFIGDQIIQILGKDTNKNVSSTTISESKSTSRNDSKNSDLPPPTPVDPSAVILTGMLDKSLVEITSCVASGSDLVINGTIVNQGTDGQFEFNVRQYEESTKLYDDLGNKININSLQIANLESDSSYLRINMISGVVTKFAAKFKGMPTIGGETQARTVKVFELRASGFKCQFRNIKIQRAGEKATPSPTPIIAVTPTPNPVVSPTPTPNPSATPAN
jgi:hypothetical protein